MTSDKDHGVPNVPTGPIDDKDHDVPNVPIGPIIRSKAKKIQQTFILLL